MSEKQYTYEEFLEIIAALRSENGDRKSVV